MWLQEYKRGLLGDYIRNAVSTCFLQVCCDSESRAQAQVMSFVRMRTFIRGLPAAHNDDEERTAASGDSLPETSREVLQSSGCPKCLAPEFPDVLILCRNGFPSAAVDIRASM
jgi:hypothetical protein